MPVDLALVVDSNTCVFQVVVVVVVVVGFFLCVYAFFFYTHFYV